MTDIHGVADHQTVPRYETLSYLPPLSREEVRQQIAYVLAQGWNAAIEHEHPDNAMAHYWPMWKLPFFGEQNPDAIMAEVEACHRQYPSHHVRLLAYDNYAQSQGTALLVYRAA